MLKSFTTRFNPTCDGPLHIGHLYIAYVNEYVAHSTAGKFIFRADDMQAIWRTRLSKETIENIVADQLHDISWAGLKPDIYASDSNLDDEITTRLKEYAGSLVVRDMRWVDNSAEWVGSDAVLYPYHAHLTAKKVIADEINTVNCLIRGMDLITESSLYAYFCDLWGIPQPRQVYLPRLITDDGEMSKTKGGHTIRYYRDAGIFPDELKQMLAKACLKDPEAPWAIENVRLDPNLKYAEEK